MSKPRVICLSLGMTDCSMTIRMEVGRHLEVVPGVLCGRLRELQQYLNVSGRILSKVKGNGDHIMEMEGTIPSSQLNLGCLQQFERAIPGWSFSIKKIPEAVLKDKDH